MNLPNRRTLGAIALIAAGITAFIAPFLLHAPPLQANQPKGPGTTTTGGTTTPTTPGNAGNPCTGSNCSTSQPGEPGSGAGGQTGTCDSKDSEEGSNEDDHSEHSDHSDHSVKDIENFAATMLKALGPHSHSFQSHHDTRTDNNLEQNQGTTSHTMNSADDVCMDDSDDKED